MRFLPQPANYVAAPQIGVLGDGLSDPVAPADFPQTILRFRNDRWAASIGLDSLPDDAWIAHFGRFHALPGNLPQPLALRYHGHQFQHYNPDIGDGRGFLFAQVRDGHGRLLDLGTKGSGTTPWSRSGDGRLTLKGGVREILATEMLEALGVYTSKTFSLIETGEALHRGDEPSPTRSAVLVRLSHSNIRIGTFQRAAFERNEALMTRLVDYALRELYGEEPGDDPPGQLLRHTVARTADLAASYMVAGFVHGVLNSDNINVTGESFDYGPWRFTPQWTPGFTAAYFDHQGLYAFAQQAEAIHWDVAQLAVSLRLLSEAPPLIEALEQFAEIYPRMLVRRFFWRLGLTPADHATSADFVETAVRALIESDTLIDRFFFDWRGGDVQRAEHYAGPQWDALRGKIGAFAASADRSHPYWQEDAPCSLHIEEVEAIWAEIAERDDWAPLETKVAAIRRMGDAHGAPPDVP